MKTMIWSIGWKNVWRNKIRSLVVIVAVMLGIFGGTMATGIMQGWIKQRVHDNIYNEKSHVQIHNSDYLFNEELQFTISGFQKTTSVLDTMQGVVAWSPRLKMYAMIQSDWAASGLIIKGVDREKETLTSEIHKNMIEGNFLEGEYKVPSIVIGSKAAETLKLLNYQVSEEKIDTMDPEIFPVAISEKMKQVGDKRFRKEKDFRNRLKQVLDKTEYSRFSDRLVNYFSFYRMGVGLKLTIQKKSGEIETQVFKVRGVYKTSNSIFDAMNAYVDRNTLNSYTGLNGDEVHEIAVLCTDNESGLNVATQLSRYTPENNVMSWRKLSPEIAMYTDFSHVIGYIYVGIILLALAFGIVNTMLMSVLERGKELGMLMAIGMNKRRVFSMIMLESVFLTLTGAITGLVFSGIIIQITSHTGINFGMWSEGFEAIGYSAIVYPEVTVDNYIGILILVIITGMVASIWPARKALRLNPAEALRTE